MSELASIQDFKSSLIEAKAKAVHADLIADTMLHRVVQTTADDYNIMVNNSAVVAEELSGPINDFSQLVSPGMVAATRAANNILSVVKKFDRVSTAINTARTSLQTAIQDSERELHIPPDATKDFNDVLATLKQAEGQFTNIEQTVNKIKNDCKAFEPLSEPDKLGGKAFESALLSGSEAATSITTTLKELSRKR